MKNLNNMLRFLFVLLLAISANLSAQERQKKEKPERPDKNVSVEDLKRELGDDWENILISKIRQEDPETIEQLEKKKETNPSRYYKDLTKLWRQYKHLEKLKYEDPERYKTEKRYRQLEQKSKQLARDYRKSDSEDEKAKIQDELKICLTKLFDLREKKRNDRVMDLEKEVENLKAMLKYRKEKKDEIIENRLNEMLSEDERMKW